MKRQRQVIQTLWAVWELPVSGRADLLATLVESAERRGMTEE
jgi:hypothetical protein